MNSPKKESSFFTIQFDFFIIYAKVKTNSKEAQSAKEEIMDQESNDFNARADFCRERLEKEPAAENLFSRFAEATPIQFAQKILELSNQQCDYLEQFIRILILQKGRKFCGKILEQLKRKVEKEQATSIANIFLEQIKLICSPLRHLYGITDKQVQNL